MATRTRKELKEPARVVVVRKISYFINGDRSKRLDWGDIGHIVNPGDVFEFRGRDYRLIRIEEEPLYCPLKV